MKNQVLATLAVIIVLTVLSVNVGNASPQASITLQSSGVIQPASTPPPTYSSLSVSSTIAGATCTFSSTWTSSVGLSQYIFGCNITGSWVNQTAASFKSTPQTVTYSATLPTAVGKIVGYEWWADDTNGNWANTGIQSLTTTSAHSVAANPNFAYTLATNATSNYVLAKNGKVLSSSTNPVTAFGTATTDANGATLYVAAGTYTFTSVFYMDSLANEAITFSPNSLITITSATTGEAFGLFYDTNCTLIGLQGNGNAVNIASPTDNGFVEIWDCDGCVVTQANITNCARYGVGTGDDSAGYVAPTSTSHIPCGVTNSLITFCDWNGISLTGDDYGDYAMNNTVAYCSDVGITCWAANGCYVIGNYIHDMNGTTGAESPNPSAHYGIAVEDNDGYETIENNTIVNCGGTAGVQGVGICIGTGNAVYSNLIAYNNITNCNDGIASYLAVGDVITCNLIANWGTGYVFGINPIQSTNEIITSNTLISSSTSTSLGYAIYSESSNNCSICDNTITIQLAASDRGIVVGSNYNLVSGNNVQASTGIYIASGCVDSRVYQNTLGKCTTQVSNSGTGTITTFRSPAILTLNCPSYYGTVSPAAGSYSESTSTQVTITLTPEAGYTSTLNVDGVNVTLTDNAYTLSMSSDHTVYAIFSTSG